MIGQYLGSYRITGQIGSGGMGVVYSAEHTTLGGRAAVKVLLPELSQNQDMVARIFSEARAAALIDHPGMVRVYDHGRMANGAAYIVMELLQGESLARRMDREGRLPVDVAVAIVRQVASAVGAAHQLGIVHRDIKPDNVFLVADPEVAIGVRAKLLDFGIAKLTGDGPGSALRTRTGVLMGTPMYMSPEQCRGASSVDGRADIYSLGCILFELVVGRTPFVLASVGEVIAAQLYAEAPRLRSIDRKLPAWLDAVVARALAKDPDRRQQTMEELVVELGGRKATAPPLRPASAASAPKSFPLIAVSPTPTAVVPPAKRRRRGLVWATAATLGLGAALAVVLTHGGTGPRDEAPRVAAAPEPEPKAAPPPVAAVPAPPPVAAVPAPPPVAAVPAPPPVAAVPAPPVAAPAAPSVDARPAEPTAPAEIALRISSEPAGAEVFRAADGIRIGVTPLVQTMPRTDGTAVFLVRLSGFQDARVELAADHDSSTHAVLVKARKEAKSAKKAKILDGAIDPFGQ